MRDMGNLLLLLVIGFATGILSGLIGVGGGIIIIPILVFLFGFTQQQAQGTTLAMLVPPIGILAAWTYYKAGYADLKTAGLLCLGFFFGGLIGARIATGLPNVILQRIFGVALFLISLRMILGK
jgi:uncharacterized membrane protein YfcA